MTYTSKLNETRYILSDSWEGKSWNKSNASFTLWKIGRIFKYIFPSYSPTFPLHYPQNSISNLLLARVSTKWLNLLRKICAIFAQILFLQTFALFLRMKRNEFCAVLRYLFCAKPEIFFAKVAHKTKFQFCAIFLRNLRKTASFTQNVTFQANCQKLIF